MTSSLHIILAILFLCITSRADLISDVCSKSVDPAFCTRTLRTDPAARAAPDLRSLGRVVVVRAKSAARVVVYVSASVGGQIGGTCVETSRDAIDNLNESSKALRRPGRVAVGDLQTKASAALSDVATCDDEYEDSGRPEPAKLKAATAKAQGIISILLVIANQL
ncbi:Unknown protein [Striga hermonthica]|uniref:Pectinesterase inhibitor domain-containing protein n=1 Tax=Striga hermonthica TaxID=68872 RepID=A0A9N7R4T6_STRHE|nr:Unknown protein [Striga hermonthica]